MVVDVCQHLEEDDDGGPQDDRGQGGYLRQGGGRDRADEDTQSLAGQSGQDVRLRDDGGGRGGLQVDPGHDKALQAGGAGVEVNPDGLRSATPTH